MIAPRLAVEPGGEVLRQDTLLRTKLYTRSSPRYTVPRPHLVARLDQALTAPLTLLSAPAGFGKTTLLSQWLARRGCSAAWLSLGARDNDPVAFLKYLIAAMQTVTADLGKDAQLLLAAPFPRPTETVLTTLVDDLCARPTKFVLVLDDYHQIDDGRVHSATAFLLEHMPAHVHLVIASRIDPPLPLARFRSRGQLVELRIDALAFSLDETDTLLNRFKRLNLSAEEIASLHARTEGWIAGLELAALALRGRPDHAQFIKAFTGGHRHVLDFLVDEVLVRQPKRVQDFLLQTSILDRLSGPLCEAVTGQVGGQKMLEQLEADNLFLVPLDDERQWYRYQHLFADALASELRRSQSDIEPVLHLRASEWYQREGFFAQAIEHALAARDYSRAARLIEHDWQHITLSGEMTAALSYLERLPPEVVQASVPLGIAQGWWSLFAGKSRAVESHLRDVDSALALQSAAKLSAAQDNDLARSRALAELLRAHVTLGKGDRHGAVELVREVFAIAPQFDALIRGSIYHSAACVYEGADYLEKAIPAYVAAISDFREIGYLFGANQASAYLARAYYLQGRLHRAAETCLEVLRFGEERGASLAPAAGLVHVVLAEVLREWNDLDEAERHARQGMALGERGGLVKPLTIGGVVLAKVRQARCDLSGALAALEDAESVARKAEPRPKYARLAACRARLWLEQGDLAAASRWAEDDAVASGQSGELTRREVALLDARLLAAQGKLGEAIDKLDQLLHSAEAAGRTGIVIEILVLRALAKRGQGSDAGALCDLSRALELAEPAGYVRVFLDEGPPLASLLSWSLAQEGWSASRPAGYAKKLLAMSPTGVDAREAPQPVTTERQLASATAPAKGLQKGIASTLTDREMDVLRLICEGCSNHEIAERLVVTLHTTKKHTTSILLKLGATRRTQAIAWARQLGLV